MKRTYLIILLSIILIQIVAAEANDAGNNTLNIDKQILKDPTPKIDEKLENNLKLPENVQIVARIIFGIKNDITISAFILLIAIWAWVLLLLSEILKTMPFFDNTAKRWLGAFAINIITAITGVYVTVANFFVDFGSYISFLKDWSAGLLFLSITAIMLFFALFQKLLKKWIQNSEREKYKELGVKSGYGIGYAKAQAEAAAEAERTAKK
ncbi:MAG: hypothetical protein FJZ43_04685 [Candidatus Staskawiczbacteria bacterium]|nr:hypothetical protein [Candidatus Staskawiczbacteria bacterium]